MNKVVEKAKTALRKILKYLGDDIDFLSAKECLKRIKERGVIANTLIDIGASNGCWSLMAELVFPELNFFLVEANIIHQESLIELSKKKNNFNFVICAAGDKDGDIYFDDRNPFGGMAFREPNERAVKKLPVRKIDTLVKDFKLIPPFILKLDTHGFEAEILSGAEDSIKDSELIIIETYNYNINESSLLFFQICDLMFNKYGFRCIEIADPMLRPLDKSFWQMDIFFIKNNRNEFKKNSYL